MTTIGDACDDLATWLPHAASLVAEPDVDGTRGHGKPGSRPPWNSQAANALLDALEGIRRLEHDWRTTIAGRNVTIRPIAVTGRTLESIQKLSAAVTTDEQRHAVTQLTRWTTTILQLPAIGRQERWRKIDALCPYCSMPMLLFGPESGRVTCLRFGACWDSRDCHPVGALQYGAVSGEESLVWADGLVQVPQTEAARE
jgi:hypothetical protein